MDSSESRRPEGQARLTAGVDVGTLTTKAVVMEDDRVLAWALAATGESSRQAAEAVLGEALRKAGRHRGDLNTVAVTGVGKKAVDFVHTEGTEVLCAARGVRFVAPRAMGVIEVGAESSRVLRLDPTGKIVDFALNGKCAAGTGVFLDAMAKLMGVELEEMGPLSLTSTADVNVDATCVVFAESEVISQVHRRTPKADILNGIHKAIAIRVHGMVSKVGIDRDVVAVGGVSLNTGVISCLEKMMRATLIVPELPQIIPALGAALFAKDTLSAS